MILLYNVQTLIGKQVKCQGVIHLSECNIYPFSDTNSTYFDTRAYESFFIVEYDGDYSYLKATNKQTYRIASSFLIQNFSITGGN